VHGGAMYRTVHGGGGGIRTPGPAERDCGFQDRRLRPLGHSSASRRMSHCSVTQAEGGNRQSTAAEPSVAATFRWAQQMSASCRMHHGSVARARTTLKSRPGVHPKAAAGTRMRLPATMSRPAQISAWAARTVHSSAGRTPWQERGGNSL
jgi:hypothetical protein